MITKTKQSKMDVPPLLGTWKLQDEISSGSFGRVFRVVDNDTGIYAAAKLEKSNCKVTQVHYEYMIYAHIQRMAKQGTYRHMLMYFLDVYEYGTQSGMKYMVMELVGDDLSKLNRSTLSDTYMKDVSMGCIHALCAFHRLGYLHRDIKPSNFAMGLHEPGPVIKLIDLGLAKRYLTSDHNHIRSVRKQTQVGTLRYSSMYSGMFVQSSRRDDIISCIYALVNIWGEKLPWQDTPEHIQRMSSSKQKRAKAEHVLKLKRIVSPQRVTRGLPSVFAKILASGMCLGFEEEPPYDKYINLLHQLV